MQERNAENRKSYGSPPKVPQGFGCMCCADIFPHKGDYTMLNQAGGDRQILAKQLNISPHQLSYVTNSGAGEGLIFYGNCIIPFVDKFPKDTQLYRIMTTRPQESSIEKKSGGKQYEEGSKNYRYRSNSSRRNDRHYRHYPQGQGEHGGYAVNNSRVRGFRTRLFYIDKSEFSDI